MFSCKIGLHRWTKREKQWVGKKVYITKRCRHCGALKSEAKEQIKKVARYLKDKYRNARGQGES